jgi:hypothetical protein
MIEAPTPVVIGGVTFLCPSMPFYCLERAWPHIQRLSRMGQLNQALAAAQMQTRMASTPEEHTAATTAVEAAHQQIAAENADFVGQTREAIEVIVAALALDPQPPSYETLSRQVRADELVGIHVACAALMDGSGLMRATTNAPGEGLATIQAGSAPLNGAGSLPN